MASTASGRPLVIVESPAKAKTISRFLGDEFDVRASVGHVADLPSKGLAVDVDNGFKPTYELTERGKQVVRDLRAALKDASELYLATDEDREGEAISWHLLEYLKPKVPVKRMVFHEITRAAIDHAVENPRGIDYGLVDAAETRRILDRLYGYEVSPILWRKVNRGLSAGRVQSPTIRLIVERERERIAFISAGYWDLELLTATAPAFTARLLEVDGVRVATGRDFDAAGRADERVRVLDEAEARRLASGLSDAEVSVRSVEEKPYRSSPKAPFMTSTLQQEAGRRLRLSSSQVMRLAQGLYEQGFITYMRTDNVVLSGEALSATRAAVEAEYGASYLSDAPKQYSSKSKNAQEAHEAIRPTTPYRSPKSVSGEIRDRQQLALYTLIWQRTLASQMADARGVTVSVRIGGATTDDGTDCLFAASGTTITFPGHRAVLDSAPSDGDEQSGSGDDVLLPELAVGDRVPVADLTAEGHSTSPPARFTEASLVKRLEELGIGRPSTWASIIQTVQDRGYVWKKGQALVPTWTAFAVVGLLEQHFDDLVDYELTAKIEEDLDGIADGSRHKDEWLQRFYFGADDLPGLKTLVEENLDQIDAAKINTFPIGLDEDGNEVVAKPGRYGPYVKRGEDTASIPDTLAPDELTIAEAIRLLSLPKSDEPIGELDGLPVFAKNGRYGPYVQWGTPDAPPPGVDKPRMTSLFATMSLEHITMEDAERLLTLPRVLGIDPNDGEEIRADNGRYGPYVVKGRDFRSIDSEDQLLTISLDEAVRIFELPKVFKRAGRSMAASGPLREFGDDPVSGRKVVARDGRFGVYVTDGETNASIGKGDRIEDMLPERAFELLAIRREQAPNKKTAKRAAPKKAAAKKTSKKVGAKKSVARKSPAKKARAKRASGDAD
ncbi:MAG: type I DNA topoisomerase [Ilumatobacteraceae bacterium]